MKNHDDVNTLRSKQNKRVLTREEKTTMDVRRMQSVRRTISLYQLRKHFGDSDINVHLLHTCIREQPSGRYLIDQEDGNRQNIRQSTCPVLIQISMTLNRDVSSIRDTERMLATAIGFAV